MIDEFWFIQDKLDLAMAIGVPLRLLTYVVYVKGIDSYYHTFSIPKKDGSFREINAPDGDLKDIQRRLAKALWIHQEEFYKQNKIRPNIAHAFEKGKSIITNANNHRKKRYVLNVDLERFFDSFHFGRVRGYFNKNRQFELPLEVATIIAQLTCYKGKLPQGAPSSPIITNLIFSIVDIRIIHLASKYHLDYTRYADDMTFSTNDKKFIGNVEKFLAELKRTLNRAGFSLNDEKTRLSYRDSRQAVTGIIVNEKLGIDRRFCKLTRAMADSLYRTGSFTIDGEDGTISQLEGRFSFIHQIDEYNNELCDDPKRKRTSYTLNSREKQYRLFLFYKYFFSPERPVIITEGFTDINYLKAALKKYADKYPRLVTKIENDGKARFDYHISFLRRTNRLNYFFRLSKDGACDFKNIYNLYFGKNRFPNLYDELTKKKALHRRNPVILLFDNEESKGKPLSEFKKYIGKTDIKNADIERGICIKGNLFFLTNPKQKHELNPSSDDCMIEYLIPKEAHEHKIKGKKLNLNENYDPKTEYGKRDFSYYILDHYNEIDLSGFMDLLDSIERVCFGGKG